MGETLHQMGNSIFFFFHDCIFKLHSKEFIDYIYYSKKILKPVGTLHVCAIVLLTVYGRSRLDPDLGYTMPHEIPRWMANLLCDVHLYCNS